jgi:hypothetical protein
VLFVEFAFNVADDVVSLVTFPAPVPKLNWVIFKASGSPAWKVSLSDVSDVTLTLVLAPLPI